VGGEPLAVDWFPGISCIGEPEGVSRLEQTAVCRRKTPFLLDSETCFIGTAFYLKI